MKQHLVSLLLEDYKIRRFIENVEKEAYISLDFIHSDALLDIVLDIVGFPPDNSAEYDYQYLNTSERSDDTSLKVPDENLICRDWLTDEWYEVSSNFLNVKIIKDGGILTFEDKEKEQEIEIAIGSYVDWLYEELEKFKKEQLQDKEFGKIMMMLNSEVGKRHFISTASVRKTSEESDTEHGEFFQVMPENDAFDNFFEWYTDHYPYNQFHKTKEEAVVQYLHYYRLWKEVKNDPKSFFKVIK